MGGLPFRIKDFLQLVTFFSLFLKFLGLGRKAQIQFVSNCVSFFFFFLKDKDKEIRKLRTLGLLGGGAS